LRGDATFRVSPAAWNATQSGRSSSCSSKTLARPDAGELNESLDHD
jgi:hypothetical protein